MTLFILIGAASGSCKTTSSKKAPGSPPTPEPPAAVIPATGGSATAAALAACAAQAKQAMLKLTVPTGTQADYAALLQQTTDHPTQYLRQMSSSVLNSVSVDHNVTQGALFVSQNYTLTLVAADPSVSAPSYLTLETATSLRRNNVLESLIDITTRIDGQSGGCPQTTLTSDLATFTDLGNGTVQMQDSEMNNVTGEVASANTAQLAKTLLTTEAQLAAIPSPPVPTATTYNTFGGVDSPNVTIAVTPGTGTTAIDPISGQSVPFTLDTVTESLSSTTTLAYTVITSSASVYWKSTIPNLQETTESINLALFQAATVVAFDGSPQFFGFAAGDFYDDTLSYALGTPQATTFSNFAAYFTLAPFTSAQLPAGAPTNAVWQQITNRDPGLNPPPLLAQPYAVDPNADPAYLASTYYINYSDPVVQAHVTNVKALLSANYTGAMLLTAILQDVVKTISYDTNSAAEGAITVQKASDALSTGKGVCQHFAAAFVAIARALNLPARVVDGYYLNTVKGTPVAGAHAWVEVDLGGAWIPLEPQIASSLYVQSPNYLPLLIDLGYESTTGKSDAVGLQFALGLSGLTLVKLSN